MKSVVSIFRTLGLMLLAGATCCQALAQGLPDPFAGGRAQAADSFRAPALPGPAVAVSPGSGGLPSPSYARSMAERVRSGVDGLTDTVQKNQAMIRRLDGTIRDCDTRIPQLQREKERVLDEYRRGAFCGGCGQTRSQLEAKGEPFPHPNQEIVAATPEQLAAKEREYNQRIDSLARERATATQVRGEKLEENKQAWDQIQQGLRLWQTAITLEQSLIAAHEDARQSREESEIKQAQRQLEQVDTGRRRLIASGKADRGTLETLDQRRALWQGILNRTREARARRIDYYWHDQQQAREDANREFAQLGNFIRRTHEYGQYGTLGFGAIPTLSVELARVSVSTSPEQLGLRFAFGSKVSGNLIVGVNNATASTEVKAFLEVFGRVAGVAYRTAYTPDGFEQGYSPVLGKSEPAPKGPTFDLTPKPLEEKPKDLSPLPKLPKLP